jgi:hypothetical protein
MHYYPNLEKLAEYLHNSWTYASMFFKGPRAPSFAIFVSILSTLMLEILKLSVILIWNYPNLLITLKIKSLI